MDRTMNGFKHNLNVTGIKSRDYRRQIPMDGRNVRKAQGDSGTP